MDAAIIVAVISAAVAIIVPAVSFYLTKKREREADWRKYKFEQYKEFVLSISGIVGTDSTPEGNRIFARTCNTLHLIGSKGVLTALHAFQDETRTSNADRSDERHDALLSNLIWEIRKDLDIPQTADASEFIARLWTSGAPARNDNVI